MFAEHYVVRVGNGELGFLRVFWTQLRFCARLGNVVIIECVRAIRNE